MFTAHSQSQSRWYLRHDAVIKHPNKDEPSKMSSISCEIIGKNQNNRSNNHHNGHSTKLKSRTKQQLINKFNCNIILLSLCEPFSDFYSLYETPRDAYCMILNIWMTKLFTIASNYNIPIIDLTRTIYAYDRSHYGQSIFENSNKTTQFIIDLIDFIFKNHNFQTANNSIIYYSSKIFGGIKYEKKTIQIRENYTKNIKTQSTFKNINKNTVDDEKKKYTTYIIIYLVWW